MKGVSTAAVPFTGSQVLGREKDNFYLTPVDQEAGSPAH
jgi:hypothetical protein